MLKFISLFITIFLALTAFAQEGKDVLPEFNASYGSYASSGKDLPFWMVSNQNGVFSMKNSSYQLFQFGFVRDLKQDSLKNWGLTYGTNLVYGYAGASDFQLNQYWLGTRYKWLVMKIGAPPDPVLYGGLSSTNGNMDWSNNSRPLTGISLSTNDFIPFLFWKKWFTFKAFYSEYILFEKQYIDHEHLHHKYVYGRGTFDSWKISLGLDHWVDWGGISPDYGKLPGFENYINYIFALKGGSGLPSWDKRNAAGNSLGLYVLTIEKEYRDFWLTFYYNHPFEDRSGMLMANLPDGLWGLYLKVKKERTFLNNIVYEFQNTMNQSGTYNMIPVGNTGRRTGRGDDNYFNHGIYKSGHVHYNRMMGTPLFVPVIDANGISQGFDNTRIWMHHIGLNGWLSERLSWKSLLTWSRSFGTYNSTDPKFPYPLDQFSFLTEFGYNPKSLPIRFNVGIAGDYGERFQKRAGGYAGISWKFR